MPTVSELVSSRVAQIISDVQTWSIFYNVKEEGAVGDGTTDDYSVLNNLFNTTITGNAVVIFPRGSSGYRVGSNLTIPNNVFLYFVGEATLKPDVAKTITINGGILAGIYPIFSGLGTIIGNPIAEKFFPQWWGAKGDGTTNDTAAVTAAKNTVTTNGGTIFFPKGNYLVTDSGLLTPPSGVTYVGDSTLSNFKVGVDLTSIPAYTIVPALTASRALISNGGGSISASSVTSTELGYIGGVTSAIQTQINAKISSAEKGAASGVVPLNSSSKIDTTYIPDSILGQLEYQGTWNATTNTPTLPVASTVKGHYYVVSTGGTYETIVYVIGDWIVSNGTIWQKVDNTDAVSTVFGRSGNIVPATNDYTFAQIDKTTSSLADLTTRSAADLTSGFLPMTRIENLSIQTAKYADGSVTSAKLDPAITVAGIPLATHIALNPIDHPDGSVTNIKIATGIDAAKLADGTVSNTEFQYINSLSSNVQTQINTHLADNVTSFSAVDQKLVGSIMYAYKNIGGF